MENNTDGVHPWKVLIVDDEEEVHRLTRMVLEDFMFEGAGLDIITAFSGHEAVRVINDVSDIALIMLDVVMETDDAGLKVVRYVRDVLKNDSVQIVLRTGQPGLAPPQEVISEYAINSYNSKIELTAQKIYTIVTASLRAYKLASSLNAANARLREELVQRKRDAEEILKLSRFQETIINDATIWLCVIDDKNKIVIWNKAAEMISGYSIDEVSDFRSGWRLFFPDPGYAEVVRKEFVAKLLMSDTISDYETTIRCKDGYSRDISWNVKSYKNTDGTMIGSIILGRDVTEHKKLEGQFLQAQKMEAVGRMAGGIAHDFNNMLTVIRGHCELLLVKMNRNDSFYEKVNQIDLAAERAENLTRQLLAFSRHRLTPPKAVSLDSIIKGMKDILERLVAENIRLIIRSGEKEGIIKADSGQIEQAIMNLVVNARDAMPDGGELVIEIRHSLPGETDGGPMVYLIVSDTGTGMEQDTLDRIFEPFFTTKDKGKGTGLGLSTVYGIVNQNKGNIRVETSCGAGSTFIMSFPGDSIDDDEDVPVKKEIGDNLYGKETILVVEDQPEVLEMTSESLRFYGYRVIEAQNAGSALLICEKNGDDIDLVLTDIRMDLMDGTQLAKRLVNLYPQIKIVFMSGYTENTIGQPDMIVSGKNFIQKPFSIINLLSMIRQRIDSGSS